MEQRETLEGKVSVIFPTYNERDNIGPLILEVLKYTPADTEVIVVDDDSPDGTWKVVEEMLAKTVPNLHLLRRIDKRGLASALRDGIAVAAGRHHRLVGLRFLHAPGQDRRPPGRDRPRPGRGRRAAASSRAAASRSSPAATTRSSPTS